MSEKRIEEIQQDDQTSQEDKQPSDNSSLNVTYEELSSNIIYKLI